ncbi:uncharacterized protein YdaU (DUF1376 family) [Mesorhizobium jarvisii]
MADLPWMQVYVGDEEVRTSHLSAEEFGAYERLRRHYWSHGSIPSDDARRARITRVDVDRWEDVRSAICELFEEGWRLPQLDKARSDAATSRELKVASGKKGAAARWGVDSGTNATATGKTNSGTNADANGKTNGGTNADTIGRGAADPVADAMRGQWPSAPASEEVRNEERLAPTPAREANASAYLKASRGG